MKRLNKLVSLSLQSALYYKMAFLFNLFSPMAVLGGQFMLWSSLYRVNGGGVIGSYTEGGMYAYLLAAFFVNNLFTWSSENNLSREIRSGAVTARCMRPVPFITQSLASMMGSMLPQALLNTFVVGALYAALSWIVTPPSLSLLPIALISTMMGVLLRMMMVSFLSLLCFYTTSHLGLSWARTAITSFFSGALIPISMFPVWLRTFTYYTPFPLMLQMPVALFLGQPLPLPIPLMMVMQVAWALLFFVLHQIMYERIRRNMVFAGG